MNQEQAREIAETVFSKWRVCGGTQRHMIADALHAAYEPELEALRAEVSKLKMELSLPAPTPDVGWRVSDSARLASIKETARMLWAQDATGAKPETILAWAESFEDAFERRYGGGR